MRESLVTVSEVAKYVRVRPRTVRDWIERGSIGIPVYRVQRQYRFHERDVARLVATCVEPADNAGSRTCTCSDACACVPDKAE